MRPSSSTERMVFRRPWARGTLLLAGVGTLAWFTWTQVIQQLSEPEVVYPFPLPSTKIESKTTTPSIAQELEETDAGSKEEMRRALLGTTEVLEAKTTSTASTGQKGEL